MTPELPDTAGPAPQATAADAERRLHPMSWLFVLLQQLKQFVVPLIAAFFFGGDRNELWPLIGVAVLALASVWRYFSYRYGIAGDALVIRSATLWMRAKGITRRLRSSRPLRMTSASPAMP